MTNITSGNTDSMQTNRYLDEIIDYGGLPHTRAEVIADMQSRGIPQPCIDRWLQGNDFGQRLRQRGSAVTLRMFATQKSR